MQRRITELLYCRPIQQLHLDCITVQFDGPMLLLLLLLQPLTMMMTTFL